MARHSNNSRALSDPSACGSITNNSIIKSPSGWPCMYRKFPDVSWRPQHSLDSEGTMSSWHSSTSKIIWALTVHSYHHYLWYMGTKYQAELFMKRPLTITRHGSPGQWHRSSDCELLYTFSYFFKDSPWVYYAEAKPKKCLLVYYVIYNVLWRIVVIRRAKKPGMMASAFYYIWETKVGDLSEDEASPTYTGSSRPTRTSAGTVWKEEMKEYWFNVHKHKWTISSTKFRNTHSAV